MARPDTISLRCVNTCFRCALDKIEWQLSPIGTPAKRTLPIMKQIQRVRWCPSRQSALTIFHQESNMTTVQEITDSQFAAQLSGDLAVAEELDLGTVRLVKTTQPDGSPGPILVDAMGRYAEIQLH